MSMYEPTPPSVMPEATAFSISSVKMLAGSPSGLNPMYVCVGMRTRSRDACASAGRAAGVTTITPKKTDGLERMIEVRVPIETVRDAEDRAARRYATSARLPGFRPGKAPAAMIKKRFKDAIRQQVIESLVQEAYQEVIDREKLKVASQPHVHDLKFEDGQPLSFELHVEVRPEVSLARTQGFRVTRTRPEVGDDAVRDQVEQIREQKATWSP